jgi:DNA-binding NarL/FixJ family response regulator
MSPVSPKKTSPREVTIWLVEDNERFRTNIQDLISGTVGLSCVLAVPSSEEALAHLETDAAPDVILMDIGLPGINGIEGMQKARSIAPSIQVIMLTVFDDDEKVFQAICAGASGYLLKSEPPDRIIESLKEILTGGAPVNSHIARKMLDMFAHMVVPKGHYEVTPTEKNILRLLVEGEPKKQIAHRLGISFFTVDTHLRNIYTKLQVHSQSGAVAKALKEKLL